MKWWMREVFSQRIANNREQKAQRTGQDGASRSLREALHIAVLAKIRVIRGLLSANLANNREQNKRSQ